VQLSVSASASTPVRVVAFDISGRRVWMSPAKLAGPEGATFVWDGTASEGARMDQGVYFLRAIDGYGKVLASQSVVRLK